MASIHICGVDRTADIQQWSIWHDSQHGLQLKCTYHGRMATKHPLSDCMISPSRTLGQTLLRKKRSTIVKSIAKAVIYGESYAVVHYPGQDRPYVYKMDGLVLATPTSLKEEAVFRYFCTVANMRRDRSESKAGIDANVVRQLEALSDSPETALHAYCTARNSVKDVSQGLIYPFGVNESQLAAVENAFRAQISVIEGPPGTGKTQTILNILANVLLRGENAAVVSNTNSAVENVYIKLEKIGLGHLVAKLGNRDNRKDFFDALPTRPTAELPTSPPLREIHALLERVKQHLHDKNESARLQADLDELIVERRYLEQWQESSGLPADVSLDKYKLSPSKATDLMAYLNHLGEHRIRLRDRIDLILNFRIFRTAPFASPDDRLSAWHSLQMHYYNTAILEKQAELHACRSRLESAKFDASLETLRAASMSHLKKHLHQTAPTSASFGARDYRTKFDEFVQHFPIICSGTHSIVNSIAPGAILDYMIIDEASLQDIVPGILALGCARNLVVVGDSRQLAHIPVKMGVSAPSDAYDCERFSLLDSCITVFGMDLPRTLLKEHYRCHPRIIQFCNQQFYNGALVPMGEDSGDAPLRLVVTAKGNHARQNANLRELDSIRTIIESEGDPVGIDAEGRGFIAPFRAQISLSETQLPADFAKDTIHKFQGRECDEIIFSTVLDKKRYNQEPERLAFVDDPRMVNVAVSRAKRRFTLVTGDDVFANSNGHIAALIRHVTYYAQQHHLIRAPVISAFDLLYGEYDRSLDRLNHRLRASDSRYRSEQIVAQLLRQTLSTPAHQRMVARSQVRLNQICRPDSTMWSERESSFMKRSTCDFVVYLKVGKKPVGVIEVDGSLHDRADQKARDVLKDSILAKVDIPVLRLKTIESGIEERIGTFIGRWSQHKAEA